MQDGVTDDGLDCEKNHIICESRGRALEEAFISVVSVDPIMAKTGDDIFRLDLFRNWLHYFWVMFFYED